MKILSQETIESAATIATGKRAFYQAGESITLKDGFTAEKGSDFTAQIGLCISTDSEEGLLPNTGTKKTTININSQTIPNVVDLNVRPNPFQQNATVEFTLTQPSETNLSILSATGQEIQSIFEKEWLAPGPYRLNLDAANLPTGLLYIRLQVNGEIVTKKVISVR